MGQYFYLYPSSFAVCPGLLRYLTPNTAFLSHLHDYFFILEFRKP